MSSLKALILVTSRPESVEVAVRTLGPEVLAVIFSQEVFLAVAEKCSALMSEGVEFRHRMVDDPMEISDAFAKFGLALSDLTGMGYRHEDVLLDVTGGTTPMRVGTALAAMTHGIGMVHQRVPQRYVGGNWSRDESKEIEVVPMQNPLLATGLLREGQAVELFNRRDYAAAALVFGDVVGKVRGRLSAYSVVDMLENARRRIADQGRHDDGVARLYRTVEMYHQWRLSERSIDTANVDWRKVDPEARERFLGETGLAVPPPLLDLLRARTLDRILDGDVPEDDAVLRDLLRQRNYSILAHGLEPIGEKAARRFLEYVDGMVLALEVRTGAEHATLRGL